MILKAKKVTLRPIIETDYDHYHKWHTDSEIRYQTIMHPYPVTDKLEKEWFEKAASDISNSRFIFTIVETDTQNVIGYFQFADVNFINRNAYLGIVIGEKKYQGQGLGKEIIELGLDYAFNYLGLLKISLEVLKDNEKAIKLYRKLGFVEEGIKRYDFFWKGKLHDVILMSFLSHDLIRN